MSATSYGNKGVDSIIAILRGRGYVAKKASYSSPFDILVNGKVRLEIKTGTPRGTGNFGLRKGWVFNIHRHGRVKESDVDVYILRLNNVPGFKYAIHLIIRAPLKVPTLVITLRSLICLYGRHFNNFSVIDDVLDERNEKDHVNTS